MEIEEDNYEKIEDEKAAEVRLNVSSFRFSNT
jgi:hypothetical protein